MSGGKNVAMSFRVSPRFKTLLNAAAARERRSLTNMLETLLFDYCQQHGLAEKEEPPEASGSQQTQSEVRVMRKSEKEGSSG